MKRTILDIDGIFTHESSFNRPDNLFGAQFIGPSASAESTDDSLPMTVVVNSTPKLDISQLAAGLSLKPEEIQEVISGRSESLYSL